MPSASLVGRRSDSLMPRTYATAGQRVMARYALIRPELDAVEEMMRQTAVTELPPLREAYLKILDRGGKRLRPTLALLSASLLREPKTPVPDSVIALGGAVEMLHTSTLVHDDVIDEATLRRGAPTLNTTWSAGASVLAGNYMFAQAAYYSARTGHARVNQIFSDSLEILVKGEIEQLKAKHDLDTSRLQYFKRIAWKTSSIFRIATESAGFLAGFSDVRIRALRRFGHHFGLAFQIVDDILDYISDPEALGKPAGCDLLNGYCTLPFFLYLDRQPERRPVLERLKEANSYRFRAPEVWTQAVQDFVAATCQSGAIEGAYDLAQRHVTKAQACLQLFPQSDYRQALHEQSETILTRLL